MNSKGAADVDRDPAILHAKQQKAATTLREVVGEGLRECGAWTGYRATQMSKLIRFFYSMQTVPLWNLLPLPDIPLAQVVSHVAGFSHYVVANPQ